MGILLAKPELAPGGTGAYRDSEENRGEDRGCQRSGGGFFNEEAEASI